MQKTILHDKNIELNLKLCRYMCMFNCYYCWQNIVIWRMLFLKVQNRASILKTTWLFVPYNIKLIRLVELNKTAVLCSIFVLYKVFLHTKHWRKMINIKLNENLFVLQECSFKYVDILTINDVNH
jgi:hypothetical protein